MMLMTELIGLTRRGMFRDPMTDSTYGAISKAFQDGGFAPNPDSTYDDTSVRRSITQAYLETVSWEDHHHVARFLRVAERLLGAFEDPRVQPFWNLLQRDRYHRDAASGHLALVGPCLLKGSLGNLTDGSAILEQVDRIRRAVTEDPALGIGSAKELAESAAKVVLRERGLVVDERAEPSRVGQAGPTRPGSAPLGSGLRTGRLRRRPWGSHNNHERPGRTS